MLLLLSVGGRRLTVGVCDGIRRMALSDVPDVSILAGEHCLTACVRDEIPIDVVLLWLGLETVSWLTVDVSLASRLRSWSRRMTARGYLWCSPLAAAAGAAATAGAATEKRQSTRVT